ncbi:MAG: mandelate racemase/muconate lactonizing enzyme family protein [Planctomycetota bacterium]
MAATTASATGVRAVGCQLYFLPVETRVPLKFGAETLTSVVCARASVRVRGADGRSAVGWGETPLSVQWVWPSPTPYDERLARLRALCELLARAWADFDTTGHPLEMGHAFQEHALAEAVREENNQRPDAEPIPLLAALACCAVFDQALHDAYGMLHNTSVFDTLGSEHLSQDLSHYLTAAEGESVDFAGRYPADYLRAERPDSLVAWHLVGGLDPVAPEELTGDEPHDGHPVLLRDWIERDGLQALKIKLRGTDAAWDYDRLVSVGRLAAECGAGALTADFNCTVMDPAYVVEVLDRLERDEPAIHAAVRYIEQPFPYELEEHRIDVREVSRRKPLLLDESAHNWRLVALGRSLGWTGVALKTCKTLTGALLSLCWAKAHGMTLMVQDLTNPMLAQIPHVLLAAHCETLLGVETNAMQFYPAASDVEARVHPGLYQRRDGRVDLSTLQGPGFGYRVDEIARELPEPVATHGDA